jgi:hypothetical protein
MTEPAKRDSSGFELISSDESERIITSANYSGGSGFHLKYDQTSTPKEFKLTKDGISWTQGSANYTTSLSKLAAVETAFQSIRDPPNAFTLKIDDTILLDDGSRQASIDSSGFRYEDPVDPTLYNMNFDANSMTMYFNDTRVPNNNFQTLIRPEYINIEDYATNPSIPVLTNIRGGRIYLQQLAFPGRTNEILPNSITLTNGGFLTSLSGGIVNVSAPGQGNSLMGPSAVYVTQTGTGGINNAALYLNNNSNIASNFVCTEIYRDRQSAGVAGDKLYQQSVFGRDNPGNKQEYTRITHTIRNPSNNAEDGSIEMGCLVNGAYTNFIQLNGNDDPNGEVNVLKTLDLTGATAGVVKVSGSSSTNMTLDTTSAVGNGSIILNTKAGVDGAGTGLILNGNTLISDNAGGNSGLHLAVTINNVVYKIKLEHV